MCNRLQNLWIENCKLCKKFFIKLNFILHYGLFVWSGTFSRTKEIGFYIVAIWEIQKTRDHQSIDFIFDYIFTKIIFNRLWNCLGKNFANVNLNSKTCIKKTSGFKGYFRMKSFQIWFIKFVCNNMIRSKKCPFLYKVLIICSK